jgi:hypothetical protein
MLYLDYNWDLHDWGIILDEEMDADKLANNHNWTDGDFFKLTHRGSRMALVKVDPLVKFLNDGTKKNG